MYSGQLETVEGAENRASSCIHAQTLLLRTPEEKRFRPSGIPQFPDERWLLNGGASFYATCLKRVIDFFAASLLLACCLPLMLVAILLIKAETPGSPIYRQRRVGLNGKAFTLYKLRTMYRDADSRKFRTDLYDERVTAVGAFLRDKKIDEVPQLLNVILGDMSLIGPRPLSVDETEHLIKNEGFSLDTPGLCPSVLPGLTGVEQCTRSSLEPYSYRFQLNSHYADNVCLWLDLQVAKKTFFVCPLVCTLMILSTLILIKILLMLI